MIFREFNCATLLTYTLGVYSGVFWALMAFLKARIFLFFAPGPPKWQKFDICML